ncbi:MAG: indole-3-glycerol phosphate synthase TrpC [Acidimicrobiales bacterium]
MLDDILAAHRLAAAADDRSLRDLASAALDSPPPRPFRAAISQPGLSVIAEIKRRSPSKGDLAPDLDPASLAGAYEAGGAAAVSVLTDRAFFGGSPDDLTAARAGCSLPVMRKDFIVDERDVYDARLMGADAVLLIVAALNQTKLNRMRALAGYLGMAALVEIHTEEELDKAIACGADLVGVNQRDLRTFQVDRSLAFRIAPQIPDTMTKVAESGIASADYLVALADAGYDAALVGERLVTAADPAAALTELRQGLSSP